jgi:hypothetical protein
MNNLEIGLLFESLPNIRPDLIYLDGPDLSSVEVDRHGLTMSGLYFIVSAGPLPYEWPLYAGAKIMVYGRINNVRFKEKFARKIFSEQKLYWKYYNFFFNKMNLCKLIAKVGRKTDVLVGQVIIKGRISSVLTE